VHGYALPWFCSGYYISHQIVAVRKNASNGNTSSRTKRDGDLTR
jgi:hypothetical protein